MTRPASEPPPGASAGWAWYAVRCVLLVRRGKRRRGRDRRYEERTTLWHAESAAQAAVRAEREARSYARSFGRPRLRLIYVAEPFRLAEAPGSGVEIHSLVRTSPAKPAAFLRRFCGVGSTAPAQPAPGRLPSSTQSGSPIGSAAAWAVPDGATTTGELRDENPARRARTARRAALSWTQVRPSGGGAWARHVLGRPEPEPAPRRPVA